MTFWKKKQLKFRSPSRDCTFNFETDYAIEENITFFHCRFRLCIKLVLIMGLVWITEFIPLVTGIYFLYAVAGMLNCLHGVYFFFIFACKKRTFRQFCSSNLFYCKNITKEGRKQSPSLDTITTLA